MIERVKQLFRRLLAPLDDRIRPLRARFDQTRERIADQWSRLSERDQQLVTILGTGGTVLLVGLMVFLAAGHLSKLRSDIDKRAKVLDEIRDMRAEFQASNEKLRSLEARLGSAPPPRSFLEEKARETNVGSNIESMEDRGSPPNDLFRTQLIEVRLKKVSLANVTRYLHKIESSGAGMSVRSLDLTPNFQDSKYLDARIQVLALRKKEG